MTIDTYGLTSDQYEEFFEKNIRFAAQLYLKAQNIIFSTGVSNADFKTILDLYNETVYATNDDCRRYQKSNNPEALKDDDLYNISPTREEIMEQIQSVNAKVEALTDYISNLVTVTTVGLEGIATTLDDKVD